MHRYTFNLSATLRFRELIAEYGRMCRLEGMTTQQRGQQFNEFIAELLRGWGLDGARANVRSAVGEIDVVFAINDTRFILEAKWQEDPVDIGPMAKLLIRANQRLAGTRTVLLSMSGFSDQALHGILQGQQPDLLLIDRAHLEAMLSGFLSPGHLLDKLMDRASFHGEVYVPLTDLLVDKDRPMLPVLQPGGPDDSAPIVTETAPNVRGEVVLHGDQQEIPADGIAFEPDGQLLLTLPQGVVRVDPGTGTCDWAVPIPGCRGSALPCPDGSILVICGTAVLRWDGRKCQIVAGGFTGGTALLRGPDGQAWVFDYKEGEWRQSGRPITLTCLGTELGQEQHNPVDFQSWTWNAVWLSGRRFYLAGDGHFGVVDLDKSPKVPIDERLVAPHPDQKGAIRIDERTVMTASRHGTVYRIDVETGANDSIAGLNMLGLGCYMTSGNHDRAYVLEHRGGPRAFVPIVVSLTGY